MKNLKTKIKMAWAALTSDDAIFISFDTKGRPSNNRKILYSALRQISLEYFTEAVGDLYTRLSRLEMLDSVISDPSVILQSVHNGKPSVIYDCASEEDFQLLLSHDIENV